MSASLVGELVRLLLLPKHRVCKPWSGRATKNRSVGNALLRSFIAVWALRPVDVTSAGGRTYKNARILLPMSLLSLIPNPIVMPGLEISSSWNILQSLSVVVR